MGQRQSCLMGVWPEPRFHDAEGGTALPRIPGP